MAIVQENMQVIFDHPKSIFSTLTPEEKTDLLNNITIKDYLKDDFIFKEGEKPIGFQFLASGKVMIYKEGAGGRDQIIRMTKPMGIIGYRALLAQEPHIGTAVALERSIVYSVSPEYFFHRLLKNADFSLRLLQVLSRELGFSNARTVNLTQKHIRGRLAESLLLLKEKYGFENDGATLKVYLSRDEIANLSSMNTSNAIRTLTSFTSERIIATDGRKIRILDISKLEDISKNG
ncbi:MAG: Crp/Fnr family transcriptional regulator [Candidatus Saccharibacteria bacterium]